MQSKRGAGLVAALLALTLSACGSASSPAGGAAGSTPAASPTATSLPAANAANLPQGCVDMAQGGLAQKSALMQMGELVVSAAQFGLTYPATQIPQGTPQQPLALNASGAIPGAKASPINPQMDEPGGFIFAICNTSSTQSYTIQSVSARIASFTPFSGSLGAWSPCVDGTYDAQTQSASAGGCGGGVSVNESLHATFAGTAGIGATVTAAQTGASPAAPTDPNPYPSLPVTMAPGQDVSVNVGVTVPKAPGTYTFSLGLAVGSAAPVYFSTTAPALFAPVTAKWTGQNCAAPAMKAQIPASTQHAQYICPPAS